MDNKYESAQALLKENDVQFSGYLEQKVSNRIMGKWVKCFVIIFDGKIYIYSNSASKKPNLVGILATFNAIEILKNREKAPFWIFVLKPINETIPEMKFAAASEKEMNSCIKTFRDCIIFSAKKSQPLTNEDNSYETQITSRNSRTISTIIQLPPIPTETEIPSQCKSTYQPNVIDESLRPDVNYYLIDIDPTLEQNYFDNMEDVMFYGTREEAAQEFSLHKLRGSYLIRQNNDRQILTVWCENGIVKYILENNTEINTISIYGQNENFDDLRSLLKYYHEHNVPNHNIKLSIAVSLLKNNE